MLGRVVRVVRFGTLVWVARVFGALGFGFRALGCFGFSVLGSSAEV